MKLAVCVLPAKTSASPADGAAPPQFAAVVHELFAPPPLHVKVAAEAADAHSPSAAVASRNA